MSQEVEINGIVYLVDGDYPNGRYALHIKNKGTPARFIDSRQFWRRFTQAEREKLVASANAKVKVFLQELALTPQIELTDATIQTAVNALEAAGLLDSAGRAAEILG